MEKTKLEIKNGVAVIMMNDPEHLNPLDQVMDDELLERLKFCEKSKEAKVIVLAGAGRAFSAGGDMRYFKKQLDDKKYEALDELVEHVNSVILQIRTMSKIVIAAVQGHAVGGGANLALAADFIVADKTVKFAESFTKIGLAPDAGAMYLLSRAVGARKALSICVECGTINADEAERLGLITCLADEGKHLEEAIALARKLANGALFAYEMAKEQNNRINYNDFEEYLFHTEKDTVGRTLRSDDYKEAVTAFLEKRVPVYTGR